MIFYNRGSSGAVWIGLTSIPPNMGWSDNTNMDHAAWHTASGSSGERCGQIKSKNAFLWADRNCTRSFDYICRAGK